MKSSAATSWGVTCISPNRWHTSSLRRPCASSACFCPLCSSRRESDTMAETPVRILVIDDDAGQARLAQRTLERAGYAVEVAYDGDAGLDLHATRSYDVLMVDHQMPGMGGLEVLRTLATWGALPPTIMVTGHGDEAVAVEAMKLGAGDYLVKDV